MVWLLLSGDQAGPLCGGDVMGGVVVGHGGDQGVAVGGAAGGVTGGGEAP